MEAIPFTLPTWLPLAVPVWVAQQLSFHAASLVFEYCDRSGAMRGIKIRERDRKTYTRMLWRVLANQCLVLLPCMILAELSGLCFSGPARLPPARFLLSLPAMAILHDVIQYFAHRWLLHNPAIWMMRFFRHSVHHSTTASAGISACYMTAADFVIEIVAPYLVPLALVGGGGRDLSFHVLVAGLGAIGGVYEHSGYDFAELLPGPKGAHGSGGLSSAVIQFVRDQITSRAHSEHHSRGNVSFSDGFGSPGICDTLFQTRWDLVPDSRIRVEAEKEWRAQRAQLKEAERKET